jgi:hypothetical protein
MGQFPRRVPELNPHRGLLPLDSAAIVRELKPELKSRTPLYRVFL